MVELNVMVGRPKPIKVRHTTELGPELAEALVSSAKPGPYRTKAMALASLTVAYRRLTKHKTGYILADIAEENATFSPAHAKQPKIVSKWYGMKSEIRDISIISISDDAELAVWVWWDAQRHRFMLSDPNPLPDKFFQQRVDEGMLEAIQFMDSPDYRGFGQYQTQHSFPAEDIDCRPRGVELAEGRYISTTPIRMSRSGRPVRSICLIWKGDWTFKTTLMGGGLNIKHPAWWLGPFWTITATNIVTQVRDGFRNLRPADVTSLVKAAILDQVSGATMKYGLERFKQRNPNIGPRALDTRLKTKYDALYADCSRCALSRSPIDTYILSRDRTGGTMASMERVRQPRMACLVKGFMLDELLVEELNRGTQDSGTIVSRSGGGAYIQAIDRIDLDQKVKTRRRDYFSNYGDVVRSRQTKYARLTGEARKSSLPISKESILRQLDEVIPKASTIPRDYALKPEISEEDIDLVDDNDEGLEDMPEHIRLSLTLGTYARSLDEFEDGGANINEREEIVDKDEDENIIDLIIDDVPEVWGWDNFVRMNILENTPFCDRFVPRTRAGRFSIIEGQSNRINHDWGKLLNINFV